MGVSLQEFLAGRVACPVCDANGDQAHCITALLSREDSCILYNSIFHNQDHQTESDVTLLQNLRANTDPNKVLDYYARSEKVVQRINSAVNSKDIWNQIYRKHIPSLLEKVRAGQLQEAAGLLTAMLVEVENTY